MLLIKEIFLLFKGVFFLDNELECIINLPQFKLKISLLRLRFNSKIVMCLLNLLFLDLPVAQFRIVQMHLSFNKSRLVFRISFYSSGLDFSFNHFVFDYSNILQMSHLELVNMRCDLRLLSLVIHLVVGLSCFDLFDFLFKLSPPLCYSKPSLSDLLPFVRQVFLSSREVIFSPIKL